MGENFITQRPYHLIVSGAMIAPRSRPLNNYIIALICYNVKLRVCEGEASCYKVVRIRLIANIAV